MQYIDSTICPGVGIIITGYIGLGGTAVLARQFREKIDAYYPGYLSVSAAKYDETIIPQQSRATEILKPLLDIEINEGGLLTALWELAKTIGIGFELDMRKIPIKQETVEICELLEVNPYHLESGGAHILLVNDGESEVIELAKQGINAVLVGFTNSSKAHVLNNDGVVSHINRPEPDELTRLGLK